MLSGDAVHGRRPSSLPRWTAWVRRAAPSLSKARAQCVLTVFSETKGCVAPGYSTHGFIRSHDAPPAIASRRAMSVMIVREPMKSTTASAIQSTGIISMAC